MATIGRRLWCDCGNDVIAGDGDGETCKDERISAGALSTAFAADKKDKHHHHKYLFI